MKYITRCTVTLDVDLEPRFGYRHRDPEATPENRKKMQHAAGQLMSDIRRHVDGFSDMTWGMDIEERCEFCGRDPEPDEDGIPCCCNRAAEKAEANLLIDEAEK